MAKDPSNGSSEDVEGRAVKLQSSGLPRPQSNTELKLKRDPSNLGNMTLSDFILSAGVSSHGMDSGDFDYEREDSTKKRSSFDSAAMVERLSHIPINLRGRAEKWEIPRSEVQLIKKIGEGQGGIVFKCRWRSLDCAAKLLNQESKTSIAYHDMINEISVIRSAPKAINPIRMKLQAEVKQSRFSFEHEISVIRSATTAFNPIRKRPQVKVNAITI